MLQNGLYAQDQIKYRNHLIFIVGGRQDFAQNDITNFLPAGANFSHLDTRFTGRVGVTYLTDFGLAPYFAYSTSFLPNAGTFVYNSSTGLSTTPAVPSDARQIEGGVKLQPRTSNSFITASIFQINETNVLVFGTLWGISVKILWALCGLALAILGITGLLMYWNRFLRHQL